MSMWHIWETRDKNNAYRVWLENLKESGCVKELSTDGSITLKQILMAARLGVK
jgi:hypothetical protein